MSGSLIKPSPNNAIKLPNKNCAYCGDALTEEGATEDHVIGKHFVPKNTLFGQWNIILRVCSKCNNAKSDLEDDISAITMQPDAYGQFASEDERLKAEALRKTRSVSRFSRKSVGHSKERLNISHQFAPGVTMRFEMSSGPQVSEERVCKLAYLHIQGFFFFVTSNKGSQEGSLIPGIFQPVMVTRRADWGNAVMRHFASSTGSWLLRFVGTAARGYFKISIRRHSEGAEVWAWALEWNQNFRTIGFFGRERDVEAVCKELPVLPMKVVAQEGNTVCRMRQDVALAPDDDCLFVFPSESDESKVTT